MFELIINKSDGSHYWTEYFNTRPALDKWLATEQTRPYWDATYTTEIIDHTPPAPDPQDAINEANRKAAIAALVVRLKQLDDASDLTAAEVKECVRKVLKLLVLKRDV